MAGWKQKKKKGKSADFFFKREGKTSNHIGIQT